jgi:hypothetical protein
MLGLGKWKIARWGKSHRGEKGREFRGCQKLEGEYMVRI